MMKTATNNDDSSKPAQIGRREVLVAGAGMAVAPLLSGIASSAEPAPNATPGKGPVTARAYGATKADAPLAAMNIERRAVGPNDVLIDILYCGICHSDIHTGDNP